MERRGRCKRSLKSMGRLLWEDRKGIALATLAVAMWCAGILFFFNQI